VFLRDKVNEFAYSREAVCMGCPLKADDNELRDFFAEP